MPIVTYEVKTPVFEGPLDLLLQLITSHRLDVTELSLSDLVAEYLRSLDLMRELDLDVTSEFLVIAATLIQLKARSLLPGDAEVDLDEELALSEERDRLLARLLANLTFKDVAAVFAHRLEGAELFVPRLAGLDPDVQPPSPEINVSATPTDLKRLVDEVFLRGRGDPDVDHLDLDLPSVGAAIADVRRRLDLDIETDFERMTAHLTDPRQMIAYFLAVLELARWGLVHATQEDLEAVIALRRGDGESETDVVSEWDTVDS